MSKITLAAVVSKRTSDVVGYIVNAPKSLKRIDVAGCYTSTGEAVNVSEYKVSHAVKNIEKAKRTQPVSLHEKSGTYTFFNLDCV
jgi:hypothetical protein